MIMERDILPGTIWKHYKGKLYTVIDIAYNSHADNPIDDEIYVVYKSMYEDPTYGANACWIRKKSDFLSKQSSGEYKFTKVS